MRTRTGFLALAMVATFAIAGCGADNTDKCDCNDNGGTNPTATPAKTSTPAQATATPGGATATPGGRPIRGPRA